MRYNIIIVVSTRRFFICSISEIHYYILISTRVARVFDKIYTCVTVYNIGIRKYSNTIL